MATWQQGQAWRVANSLNKLDTQIRAYAPRSVPPATDPNAWGSIGDTAHSSSSDHFPHYYAALGSTAVVCARDFPHAPALGLDGHVVTEALRVSQDPRIGYVIFDRHITGPNHGWRWDPYDGSDPHDTHFHVSSVHTALADDARAWALPGGGGPLMALTDEEQKDLYRRVRNAELILWYGVKGGEDSVPESLIAGTAASPVPLPAGAPLELVKTINGQGVVPTPEQWASLTAAIEAKVESAIAAALGVNKVKAGTLQAFREIGANIPPES